MSKLLGVTLDLRAARQEALWLLEKVTGLSHAQLLLRGIVLSAQQKFLLEKLLSDRVDKKKPLQYILGSVPFCDLEILVEPPILIPRPETEEWTCWLIDLIKKEHAEDISIADVCSGSGCIGLALAKHLSSSRVIGLDISDQAVDLACRNKAASGVANYEVFVSDLFDNIDPKIKFDLIVSNPPYLTEQEYREIDASVSEWEDKRALVTGNDGLAIYEQLVTQARARLSETRNVALPALVCEIGPAQKDKIINVMLNAGFAKADLISDLQGVSRIVVAYV